MVLMGIMPVGLRVAYEDGVFSFTGRVFFLSVDFDKKRRTAGVKRDIISRLRRLYSHPRGKIFLKNAYTTLKRLLPRVQIPYLKLHILTAGKDPANTALAYGAVGMALEQLQIMTAERVRKSDLQAEIDFQRTAPEVSGCVLMRLFLGQVLWYGICLGWGFWRDYRRHRRGV